MDDGTIRLQKFLSERGIAARRKAADIIRAGRVTVNGEIVREAGLRIRPQADAIEVDGTRVTEELPGRLTIMLNKPRGYICSRASGQGRTVYELLPEELSDLVPIGRLDKDSEGLLLLSNDGDLVERLTHPRHGHAKTYRVAVSGAVGRDALRVLRAPIEIDGRMTQPARVRVVRSDAARLSRGNARPPGADNTGKHIGGRASPRAGTGREATGRTVIEFVLREGRNRQVRRLCEAASVRVRRLTRIASDDLTLAGLRPGKWRELTARELERLDATHSR